MVGWSGDFADGKRPVGVHPLALVGAPPEHRDWKVGDPYVEPYLGFAVLIDAFCTVDAGMVGLPYTTTIGNRTWLQKRVHVGHNARIGVDCEICVGTVVCGEVVIGHNVKIGGNTWVKPRVRIGDGAIIGGGSVVTKDVPPHEVWAGNPARYMKNAWTHPDAVTAERLRQRDEIRAARGLAGRERVRAQYDMTVDQWEAARAAVGYPTEAELDEWNREAARSGAFHGHGADGDHA